MNQKGLIPILILIAVVVLSGAGIAGTLYVSKTIPDFTALNKQSRELSASSSALLNPDNPMPQVPAKRLSVFEILLQRGRISQKTPSSSPPASAKMSIPTPSPSVSVVATTAPTATPTPAARKNTCDVNVTYGKLGGGFSHSLLVTLIYSYSSYNNSYMTGAQWDFTGDGTFDTNMSQSNGTIEHTYPAAGTYTAKLKVQGSDGATTDVCSKSVTVPSGIEIKATGKVYEDLDCDNFPDPSENGVGGAAVRIIKMPENYIYYELNANSNGNYSFSQYIQPDSSLSMAVEPGVAPDGYYSSPKFTATTYTLGNSQTTRNLDIPLITLESINSGICN